MNEYNKTTWVDHIQDIETGDIIQQGTPIDATKLNNIENGIETNRNAVIKLEADNQSLTIRTALFSSMLLNTMNGNAFYEDFSNLSDVTIVDGIYDAETKKIYY